MSRRRQLSDEERALWTGFVRSIAPLRGSKKSAAPATPGKEAPSAAQPVKPRPPAAPVPLKPPAEAPALTPLGRRQKRRVARGRESIDARIDLHGMTQSQAHGALSHFLSRSQAAGHKIVLVVTGKGSGRSERPDAERGVLKRQVPMWLSLPEFRSLIVGFEDAHIGHGGEGALYVRLRRGR
jgi:DNA-nicking Smr family endonuclease